MAHYNTSWSAHIKLPPWSIHACLLMCCFLGSYCLSGFCIKQANCLVFGNAVDSFKHGNKMTWYKDNACCFFLKIPLPSGLNSTPRQDFLKGLTIHCWSCWSMPYRWLWRLSGLIHEIDLSRQSLPINFAVDQARCNKVLLRMQREMKYGLVELKRCWLVGFRYHFLKESVVYLWLWWIELGEE